MARNYNKCMVSAIAVHILCDGQSAMENLISQVPNKKKEIEMELSRCIEEGATEETIYDAVLRLHRLDGKGYKCPKLLNYACQTFNLLFKAVKSEQSAYDAYRRSENLKIENRRADFGAKRKPAIIQKEGIIQKAGNHVLRKPSKNVFIWDSDGRVVLRGTRNHVIPQWENYMKQNKLLPYAI